MTARRDHARTSDTATVDLVYLIRALVIVLGLSLIGASCSNGTGDDASPGTTAATSATSTNSQLVGVDEFAAAIDEPDVITINVHVPDEGGLTGTDLDVPFDQIEQSDALPQDLDTPLAVYCRSGNMSADAVDDLEAMGYTDIVELDGGFNAWIDAGRPFLEPAD